MRSVKHRWWKHVDEQQRSALLREVRVLRFHAWLRQRRVQIGLTLAAYLLLCLLPLLLGEFVLTLLALLPVFFVPPVAYLAYRLTWLEFHR